MYQLSPAPLVLNSGPGRSNLVKEIKQVGYVATGLQNRPKPCCCVYSPGLDLCCFLPGEGLEVKSFVRKITRCSTDMKTFSPAARPLL